MGYGAAAGGAPGGSAMDDYMRNYGARLQSMLADDSGSGALGGSPPVSGFSDGGQIPPDQGLGPDLYRNMGQPPAVPQAAPGGAGGAPPPRGGGTTPSGAGTSDNDQSQGNGKGTSFRDIWNAQSKEQRQQYLDKLQDHLNTANESIDTAYKTMMTQLGTRPDMTLSKSEKGMLLMEFGMKMMANSSGRRFGKDTGAAAGDAGAQTVQSAQGLLAGKRATQQRYDQMQQQLAIAQGREKSNLAARSALETGRDIRAFSAQDARLAGIDTQQQGAAARQDSRNTAAASRLELQQQGIVRSFVDNNGNEIGVRKDGKTVDLGKAAPGSTGFGGKGGTKGFATEANYRMYMDTYGHDENGPLQGDDLDRVKKDALAYASNPHAFTLTDAQKRQMAEKSADNYIRSNQLSFAGMNDDEIAAKRTQFAEQTYQRLQRNGTPGPLGNANNPSPGKSPLAGTGGKVPSAPPPGSQEAPPQALDKLRSNPALAPYFARKYGYVPPEYQKFLAPQSALH